MYQNPSTYTLGGNAAIQHRTTGLYMGAAAGFTGIFGNTADQVIASLDRAANADGSKPTGTVYFEKNNDVRSNTREPQWSIAQTELDARKINWIEESNVPGNTPRNRDDVRGAVVGRSALVLPNGSTYLPGSWADHLTSIGAGFANRGQTKATEFIAAGAAGTSGTVTEPFAFASRFPHSHIHVYNADGSTLGEAFYKSVQSPDLQLLIGDMLAQSYADMPQVQFASAPAEDDVVRGTVQIQASASLNNPDLAYGMDRLGLYVDGKLADAIAGSGAVFNVDTTTMSDGYHELRVVAVNNTAAESESYRLRHVYVNNDGRSVTVAGGNVNLAPTQVAQISVSAITSSSQVQRIELRHLGRAVGDVAGDEGIINLDASNLAFGTTLWCP